MKKLSVIIPVWNEKETIEEIISRVELVSIPNWQIEIIIVDDFSSDGTREILKKYESIHKIIYHPKNLGKGSAVKTGIEKSSGDYILIQDADLEYDPSDIPKLAEAAEKNENTAIFGSRNIDPNTKKGGLIPRLGVWFLTKEFNLFFNSRLTDLWTCYKLFPKNSASYFTAGRFESELSFSARLIKNNFKIIEVPISYNPRHFTAGKKITYLDGLKGIWVILKERIIS